MSCIPSQQVDIPQVKVTHCTTCNSSLGKTCSGQSGKGCIFEESAKSLSCSHTVWSLALKSCCLLCRCLGFSFRTHWSLKNPRCLGQTIYLKSSWVSSHLRSREIECSLYSCGHFILFHFYMRIWIQIVSESYSILCYQHTILN